VKPAAFTYHRPQRREEVDELLAEFSDEAKILAGGQSLIPILNMRLSAPAHLIDINGLEEEPTEPALEEDAITFGPLVRQFAAEQSSIVGERLALLHETLRYVAHPAIRSRGTVVGSIAHADPAAELPAMFVLLQGHARVRSADGLRAISAADLYAGHLETSLGSSEWIDEVRLPSAPAGRGAAAEEFARRRGDYALCGVLAIADPGDAAHSTRIALSFLGMGATPQRLELPELSREQLAGGELEQAVQQIVEERLEPDQDIHATAQYRVHLARRLGVRTVREAIERMGVRAA
jgi:CO/xanthine dehydrogenase FAD-binding subunit